MWSRPARLRLRLLLLRLRLLRLPLILLHLLALFLHQLPWCGTWKWTASTIDIWKNHVGWFSERGCVQKCRRQLNCFSLKRRVLEAVDPTGLVLNLNYSVFIDAIMNDREKAFLKVQEALSCALEQEAKHLKDTIKRVPLILKLLKYNLTIWAPGKVGISLHRLPEFRD